jgi:alpha-galactosidase
MILTLNSNYLELRYHFDQGHWILKQPNSEYTWLHSAPLTLVWHYKQDRGIWIANRAPTTHSVFDHQRTNHGNSSIAKLAWLNTPSPFEVSLEFNLLDDTPVLLWRAIIRNLSTDAAYLDRITFLHAGNPGPHSGRPIRTLPDLFRGGTALSDGSLSLSTTNDDLAFFSNGWQSWNYAGTLTKNDRFPKTRLGLLVKPMRMVRGTPRVRAEGHFHSDMFGILGDRKSRIAWLAGFLSQQQAFGLIEAWVGHRQPAMRMWSELEGVRLTPNSEFETDWAAIELVDIDEPPRNYHYVRSVAVENKVVLRHQSQTGWCSWYHAFQDVTQEHLRVNGNWIKNSRDEVPLNLLQLDDGFQEEIGDWFTYADSFPHGLEGVQSIMKETGTESGLWLAPFLCSRRSSIARDNRDWILRNRFGLPVIPGFLWNSFPFVLDITHPEVLEHVSNLIDICVNRYGFEYLKLDFLYAGALDGVRYNPDLTGAQALRNALTLIKEIVGENTKILGCGCPIGSGVGLVDFMRINPDVAPNWHPEFEGIQFFIDNEEGLPGTRNSLLSAINRIFMHNNWWINDPDCLLIRDLNTRLTAEEVKLLTTVIVMSAGSIIVSDHLPDLSEERVEWLAKTLPPLPNEAQVPDWFDTPTPSQMMLPLNNQTGEWFLLAMINWNDGPADMKIDLEKITGVTSHQYHVVDFWEADYRSVEGSNLEIRQVPAHGVSFLSIRGDAEEPQWLGSTLHTSQGLFIQHFEHQDHSLTVEIDLGRLGSGEAWLKVPSTPTSATFDGEGVNWETVEYGIVKIWFEKVRKGKLIVSWD